MPSSNIDLFFEEIKYSYTSMHMSLYMELFIKTSHSKGLLVDAKSNNKYSIEVLGKKYLLRNDYISYGIETSLRNEHNWGILGDMAIIQSFSYISSRFSELIDNNKTFEQYTQELFEKRGYNFSAFYSILRFIRNISVHGSTNINYTLKEEDFKDWKKYQTSKGISILKLDLNIVDKLHKLEIEIRIDELVEGYNISNIFNSYNMFMFIELCMNMVAGFKEGHK
ncbi:hypothetical protein KBC86_03675 [Candidatus Gracilibacteria bacterium]|nr:hypothetical protein [Candidatus Gracilibacteria bacterium]